MFSDNFDSYTVGMGVAENNNSDWDTWSGGPGGGEDCLVSDAFSNSPSNSFVEIPNNDLIYRFGKLTSGMYSISMQVYIPAGNSGYFNLMSGFDGGFFWNTEIYFDAGGTGRLQTGEPEVAFSWTEDMWQEVIVIVDLDNDLAEFWLAGAMVGSWPWTSGTSTGTSALQLSVNDFFGGTSTDQMYVDDYTVVDLLATAVEDDEVLGPLTFGLEQNYPNPFNPSTNIRYSIETSGHVKLAVYNVIGEEVSVLVNGQVEAGSYEVTFIASNLPSGVYIYKLDTPENIQVKKMVLMK